jgi:TPR repeat protein
MPESCLSWGRASALALVISFNSLGAVASAQTSPSDPKTVTPDQGTATPSPWALYQLGKNYALGNGVAKDVQKAKAYYEQALASSDREVTKASAFALGQLADSQFKNPVLAIGYFQKGAELGDEWSTMKLAEFHANGHGLPKDVREAQKLYDQLLVSKNPTIVKSAAFALGRLALEEPNSRNLAKPYFEMGAKLGDASAVLALGRISTSEKSAAKFYERAAGMDPVVAKEALFELAQLYLKPPLRNVNTALRYYRRASDVGNPWASYAIAQIYAEGGAVKRNTKQARKYYLLGLKSGNAAVAKASALALGDLYLKKPGKSDKRTAAKYFDEGARLGDDWSAFKLAAMYAKGDGVPKSPPKARKLLLELRSRSDVAVATAALYELGKLHMAGPLQDFRAARKYFREGSDKGDLWSTYSLAEIYAEGRGIKANRQRARALLTRLRHSDNKEARAAAEALLKKIRRS